MFTVAGRMIGHSFLHSGPSFPGLSPAILHILFGGSLENTPVTTRDCPDLDIRETLKMVNMENTEAYILIWPLLWALHHNTATNVIYSTHAASINHFFSHYVLFQLDGDTELKEFDSIHQLCLSWNLPAPNATNRKWLAEKLLMHAVISECFYLFNSSNDVHFSMLVLNTLDPPSLHTIHCNFT